MGRFFILISRRTATNDTVFLSDLCRINQLKSQIMNLNCTTKKDKRVADIVKQQYNLRVKLLTMFIEKAHLSIEEASICINISASTIYRYEEGQTHMSTTTYIKMCIYFRLYMKEHHIPFDEELEETIRQTDLFSIPF